MQKIEFYTVLKMNKMKQRRQKRRKHDPTFINCL